MDHEPPISKLHVEILWKIFWMNADMNDDEDVEFGRWPTGDSRFVNRPSDCSHRALTKTRLSSQVCRSWRRILLKSPSIWGRLIDVGFLCSMSHNDWAQEVIRRSQDSPLHMKGPIAEKNVDFFTDLLDESWERVCFLDIKFGRLGRDIQPILDRIQNIIFRPTKELRFFNLDVGMHQLYVDEYLAQLRRVAAATPDRRPFSGKAPSLSVYCHSKFSSWLPSCRSLSNVHTLSLIGHSIEVSTSNLVRSLKGMPRLETLRIGHYPLLFDAGWDAISTERVMLPLLDKIEFQNDDVGALTKLMDVFDPLPGCTIQVYTRFCGDSHYNSMQILSRYTESYFEHHPPSALGLVFQQNLLIFKDTSETRLRDSRFYLHMSRWQSTDPSRVVQAPPTCEEINAFFYPLTAHTDNGYFRSVKHLDISMDNNAIPSQTLPYFDLFRSLSQLGAVETLAVYDPDLASLNSCYAQLQSLTSPFPRLRTLQFRTQRDRYTAYHYSDEIGLVVDPPWDPSELDKYLEWHKRLGIPIEVLEYTCPAHRRDLRFLEQEMKVVGLKVKWTSWVKEQWLPNGDPCTSVEEYVFGGGNHSKLERWYHGAGCLVERLEYMYMSYDLNVVHDL